MKTLSTSSNMLVFSSGPIDDNIIPKSNITSSYSITYINYNENNGYNNQTSSLSSSNMFGSFDAGVQNQDINDENEIITIIPTQEGLEQEHERWVNLFTNPNVDPRDTIGMELGKTKEEVKQCLTETINGSRRYPKMINWIKTNYPMLYAVWMKTTIKSTGPNISKMCETKLMLDQSLYKMTEMMGIKIAYEYDGFSIFITKSTNPKEIISKITQIANAIQSISKSQFGFNIILKTTFEGIKPSHLPTQSSDV